MLPSVSVALLPTVIFGVDGSNKIFVEDRVEPIVQPPTLPPVNLTSDPVICPSFLSINALFELLIVVAAIPNPPICPAFAVTVPVIVTLPLESTSKLSVSISNLVPLNLIKLPALPAKNLGVPPLYSNCMP